MSGNRAVKSMMQRAHPLPRLTVEVDTGAARINLGGNEPEARAVINRVFGTVNDGFANGMATHLASLIATANGGTENLTPDYEFAIAAIAGIGPRDEAEAMLAVQMTAIHLATMRAAARLAASTTAQGIAATETTFNKLARTYTTQLEALKRYRSTGNQKILVQHQHVTVEDGGQAVVANSISRGEDVSNAD